MRGHRRSISTFCVKIAFDGFGEHLLVIVDVWCITLAMTREIDEDRAVLFKERLLREPQSAVASLTMDENESPVSLPIDLIAYLCPGKLQNLKWESPLQNGYGNQV